MHKQFNPSIVADLDKYSNLIEDFSSNYTTHEKSSLGNIIEIRYKVQLYFLIEYINKDLYLTYINQSI